MLHKLSRRGNSFYVRIVGAILFSTLLVLAATFLTHLNSAQEQSLSEAGKSQTIQLMVYLGGGFIIGVLLFPLIIAVASRDVVRNNRFTIAMAFKSWSFWSYFLATFSLILLVFWFYPKIDSNTDLNGIHLILKRFFHDDTDLTSFIFGTVTVIGLGFTLSQLHHIRTTIVSFSDLIDRIQKLAANAKSDDPIHIIAYTPALGYLALPRKDWRRLKKAITNDDKGTRARIICLNKEALHKWHRSFVGRHTLRGKIDEALADEATDVAEKLLKFVARPRNHEINDDHDDDNDPYVSRVSTSRMPGWYTFFTSHRAILVLPTFLPFLDEDPDRSQPTVQMIGFETTDKGIIKDLFEQFKFTKRKSENFKATKTDI